MFYGVRSNIPSVFLLPICVTYDAFSYHLMVGGCADWVLVFRFLVFGAERRSRSLTNTSGICLVWIRANRSP